MEEKKLLKERKEAKENFISWDLYDVYERHCEELADEVKDESSRALFLLGFLGILVMTALQKIMLYSHWIKLTLFSLLAVDVLILLYVILSMGDSVMPRKEVFHVHTTEREFHERYHKEYAIWKEKMIYTRIATILTMIIFLGVVGVLFFVQPI